MIGRVTRYRSCFSHPCLDRSKHLGEALAGEVYVQLGEPVLEGSNDVREWIYVVLSNGRIAWIVSRYWAWKGMGFPESFVEECS